jgi:hypothetical protein
MKHHDEELLNNAIQALKAEEPSREAMAASAERVVARLGAVAQADAADAIRSCDDVRHLFAAYRTGSLPGARALLVEAHLRDCGDCLRSFRSQPGHTAVDWSVPRIGPQIVSSSASRPARFSILRPRTLAWSLAGSFALLTSAAFLYKAYWEVPPGVRAEVQSIDGSAYLISGAGGRQLGPGSTLSEGESLRTGGGSRAVLRLTDGSTVEVNERTMLGVAARGRNMTVSLDGGDVIVQAAKRNSGHLYVKTPDCRVAVTGTVFSVDAGIKGSRVAVLQGVVNVDHSGVDSRLEAGEQLATSGNLAPEPLEDEVAWSQDRAKYLGLVAQFATLRHRVEQIPFPGPRYSSDLLDRVPSGTLLYISIPNLGDFLSQANAIFHDQLAQSPELQAWWNRGHGNNTEELDAMVGKLHEVSRYLGDEVVIVGLPRAEHPDFAVMADVNRNGLDDFLRQQFPASSANGGLTVLDEQALKTAQDSPKNQHGAYALLREHEAVFSGSVATLRELNAQLDAGASGFANEEFGKQIAAAYTRGAGIILAADLHQMIGEHTAQMHNGRPRATAMENSGLESVQYLIAEHREINGTPQNHLNLQFSGERQRVASWLAGPAPIQSLDFVSPNAAFAVAALSKDPKAIADDMIAMAADDHSGLEDSDNETGKQFEEIVRNQLAPNLGGDFLVSLDGPVLPTPAWKAVIEVHDADRVQQAFEQLVKFFNDQPHGKDFHEMAIESSQSGSQRFYAIRDQASDTDRLFYTFADGFMIAAPSRALLIETLRTHASGNTLARSASFKALLPKDDSENCSAVAYQNLSPVLSPLLSQLSGESAATLRKLASDSKPTAACAWGEENRIEAATDSQLFGFDFLTLGALLDAKKGAVDSRNNSATPRVTE